MGCTFVQVIIFALLVASVNAVCTGPNATYWSRYLLPSTQLCQDYTSETDCNAQNVAGEQINCRWINNQCRMAGVNVYLSVNANQPKYTQIPRRLVSSIPYSAVDSAADPAVGFKLLVGPASGSLLPVWSSTELLDPQPALIQLDGTFAYQFTGTSATTYPLETSFTYTYDEPCGYAKFYGTVFVTVWDPASIAAANARYHCKMNNRCIPEAYLGQNRPWVAQHVLPRIWGQIQAYTADSRPCFATPEESAKFRFENNSLIVDGIGRQGWGGQRVFGFRAVKPDQYLWNQSLIDKTANFDQACVANVAAARWNLFLANNRTEQLGVWGNVFAPVTTNRYDNATYDANFCGLVNRAHLCANAPLLTVREGALKYLDNDAPSEYDEPWRMHFNDCTVRATATFPYDLMRKYTMSGKVSRTYLAPNPVEKAKANPNFDLVPTFAFTFPQVGAPSNANIPDSNIVVKFDFFNMAIQPFSQIDMGRSFIDINNRYEVTLNIRSCLKFDFETGQDTFTVDFQWFRYKSACKLNPTDPYNAWGLGINLIIYPEAYDAAYAADTPRLATVYGQQKTFFNTVPRKIVGVNFYSTRDPVTQQVIQPPNEIGRPQNSTDFIWFPDACGFSNTDNSFKVYPCASEPSTGSNPANSCNWQNVTLRFARRNPDDAPEVTAQWTEELIIEFLLTDGQRPTLKLRPGLLQTALDAEGAFSGCSGVCRTVPYLKESLRGSALTLGDAGYQWGTQQYCSQFSQANYNGAGDWKQACGWDARSGAPGCAVKQTHDSITQPTICEPAISITCEEPDAVTYGPDDRVIFVYDVYNVDPKFIEPVSVRLEWDSDPAYWNNAALASRKIVWAFHEGGSSAIPSGQWILPSYKFLNFTILTARERSNPPLTAASNGFREWDFGFAFNPALLNENMKIRVYTTVRILVNARDTSVPYRQPSLKKTNSRRFKAADALDGLDCFVPQPQLIPGSAEEHIMSRQRQRRMQRLEDNEQGRLEYTEEMNYDGRLVQSTATEGKQSVTTSNGVRSLVGITDLTTSGESNNNNGKTASSDVPNTPAPWVLSGIILGVTIALVGAAVFAIVMNAKKRAPFMPVASGQASEFSDAVTK